MEVDLFGSRRKEFPLETIRMLQSIKSTWLSIFEGGQLLLLLIVALSERTLHPHIGQMLCGTP